MEQYISKSALVAEIEKLYNGEIDTYTRNILDRLKSNIDTLEVKEVDFDAEWKRYFEYRGEMATVNVKYLAKHFFELALSLK